MKSIVLFISLAVCSYYTYANGIVSVDEKHNSGIPENIFQDTKYAIPSSKTLTVDWSNYEFKRRLVTNVPIIVILKINNRDSYSTSLEKGKTKIVLSEKNLKPKADAKKFKGYNSGDNIDLSIGFFDLEAKSGNSYFISVWSAKISVQRESK